jgi:hypothetical protein
MKQPHEKEPKFNLDEVLKALKDQDPENLRCLYTEYSQRMRYSGAEIWHIGSVFIPLSLSGVVLGLGDPKRTVAVALSSIFLIWIWYLMSVRLDTILSRDLAICGAIETMMLKTERPMTERGLNEIIKPLKEKREVRLRQSRLAIPVLISVGWLAIITASLLI